MHKHQLAIHYDYSCNTSIMHSPQCKSGDPNESRTFRISVGESLGYIVSRGLCQNLTIIMMLQALLPKFASPAIFEILYAQFLK